MDRTPNKKESRVAKFIKACVKKQTYEILITKRRKYTFWNIYYVCKLLFLRYDELRFGRYCRYIYAKEKKYFQNRKYRIKKSAKVKKIKNKYDYIDVEKIAELLIFYKKISLKSKKDFEIIEIIIKIIMSIPLYDRSLCLKENKDFVEKEIDETLDKQVKHEEMLKKIFLNKRKNQKNKLLIVKEKI